MTSPLSPPAALAAAAAFGVADFGGGVASRRSSPASVVVGVELGGMVLVPLAFLVLPTHWDGAALALAGAGGALGGAGLILFYRAISVTLISIVAPITGVVAAAFPCLVGILGGDRLRPWQLAGIIAGLAAIPLINGLSRRVDGRTRAGVSLSLIAGLAFGGFFVLLHDASSAGVPALLSSRAGSAALGLVVALAMRTNPLPRPPVRPLVAAVGAVDVLGVVLYLWATHNGLLSITALLASFYPAFTVVCARVFTHERLSTQQTAGAGLAIAAVAMIAVA
jgi:drug/metabolite transporter (DMT)-like permease